MNLHSSNKISKERAVVKIHGLSFFEGQGVGKSEDGKVFFVEQACPGEIVEVEILESKKNYSSAKIINIIEKSSQRVAPSCSVFSVCGGCSLQHVSYELQIAEKQKVLQRYVEKKSPQTTLKNFEMSKLNYSYRERIEVHIKKNKWGFYKKKSNELVFPSTCPVVIDEIQKKLNSLHETIQQDGHYQIEKNGFGIRKRGLEGEFSQINTDINQKLKSYLFNVLSDIPFSRFFDLYSGSGNFSLSLASSFKKADFQCFELSASLIKRGQELSKEFNNIKWIQGDVLKSLKNLKDFNDPNSIILVNPPRTGLDKNLIPLLLELNPLKIIYISCNPMTLFRDIDAMSPKYSLESLKGFDMFPQTMHFETVAVINK